MYSCTLVPIGSPENVSVMVLSSTAIRISWNEVADINQHGIITEYEIMLQPLTLFGEPNEEGSIVDSTNLSITFMDLEEYVQYNISVRAYTSVGPGPYSVGIVKHTFQDGKTTHILILICAFSVMKAYECFVSEINIKL